MDSPHDLPTALARVDALHAEIDALRPLDADALGRAMQRLRLEWTYHSNAIEGNSLTYGETRALLMHGVTAHGKPLKDHLDIRRHREVIEFVEAFVRGDEPVRVDFVKEIHLRLMGEEYEVTVELPDGSHDRRTMRGSHYKETPNNVRTETGETHFYAPPLEVPGRMADLVEWLGSDEAAALHPVARAALFHHRFVEIHPFPDGNGRSARVLMNLLLMRDGFVPAVLRQEQRPAYYGALSEADGGDAEPIIAFVAGELAETMALYLRALKGEPDPTAFDKRLGLMKVAVESKASSRLDRNRRAQLAQIFVLPLIEQLVQRVERIADLFEGVEYNISASTEHSDLRDGRARVAIENGDWDRAEWSCRLLRLRSDPDLSVPVSLGIMVTHSSLAVSRSPGQDGVGPLVFSGGSLPGSDDAETLALTMAEAILGEIHTLLG